MLNRQIHEFHLKNLLRDIINDSKLSSSLALKGGTCLYLFYNLDRFSVDLDFDLLGDQKKFDSSILDQIFTKNLQIKDFHEKKWTHFWLLSYEHQKPNIKIEVNKRHYDNHYEPKQFYGMSIMTLDQASLFAHKLCAITDRRQIVNRDLYDAWFMFNKQFPIREQIIQARMNQSLASYLQTLLDLIPKKVYSARILQGLGELLNDNRKRWVKEKLLTELQFQLKLKLESLK